MAINIKKFIQKITRRQLILGITGLCSLLVGLLLCGISGHLASVQDTQKMADRWDPEGGSAQVSCFFSREAEMTEDQITNFEHMLDRALEEASIVNDSPNAGARLWADSYSSTGTISIRSNKTTMEVSAVGIGGDFFQFHPLKLVSGAYFSGNDVLTDYIVIDEDAAWQLFGSSDVAGQMVTISGIPHVITGVVERQTGRLAKASGLTSSVAYVSYSSLEKYGISYGLNTFEIVMPNPVSDYARNYVAENIGVAENEVEVVENSNRYTLIPMIELLTEFGTRSMSSKAIIYPYWENIARGYEDIIGLLLIFILLLFLYPAALVVIAVVIAWRHKTWTASTVFHSLRDKSGRLADRMREKRKQRKKPKEKKSKEPKHGFKHRKNEEEKYEEEE